MSCPASYIASPYGIFDPVANRGHVFVGISRDTPGSRDREYSFKSHLFSWCSTAVNDSRQLPATHDSANRSCPDLIRQGMSVFSSIATKFRKQAAPPVDQPGGATALAVDTFKGGINCTQAILSAWGSQHGLDRDTAMKIGGAFGSGMNMGETCGAVTGALMVIGLRHAKVSSVGFLSRARTEKETLEFIERFKARNGTVSCKELLGCDLGTAAGRAASKRDKSFKTRCPKFVRDAAEILEEMH